MNARAGIGLGVVLACLAGALALGAATKAYCASGNWADGRQYRDLCYSDIVPLYGTESLTSGRLPFIDHCPPGTGECDEYPVLTMYSMRLAAWVAPGLPGFFVANAFLLALAAFAVGLCLYLVVGGRALYFALAPTLIIYAFMNWDLLAVALATAATLAFLNKRNVWAGVLIGLGTAAKFYPVLLLVPFIVQRFKERDPDGGIHIAWSAAGTWLAVNLPFALLGFHSWWEFFRFNSLRVADWDSLWFIGCTRLVSHQATYCPSSYTGKINALSAVAFVLLVTAIWLVKRRRDPGFARWTMGFPLVAIFLLTNKVYSPQYGLWLLPWFALVLPRPLLFAAFELADIGVFVTRFRWFATLSGMPGGLPMSSFEVAVLVRDAILITCLVVFALDRRRDPLPAAAIHPPRPEAARAT